MFRTRARPKAVAATAIKEKKVIRMTDGWTSVFRLAFAMELKIMAGMAI